MATNSSTHGPGAHKPEARLLVVDDEPNIRELLSASLRYAGFEVATAPDGQQALAVAEQFRPDLLIEAVAALDRPAGEDLFAWVGAESATVRAVRADLRGRWGLRRGQYHAIGYWRRGRSMGG